MPVDVSPQTTVNNHITPLQYSVFATTTKKCEQHDLTIDEHFYPSVERVLEKL